MDTYQTIRGVRSFLQNVKPGMVYQTRVRSSKPDVYARRCERRDRPYLGPNGRPADYRSTDAHRELYCHLHGWFQFRMAYHAKNEPERTADDVEWRDELERIGMNWPAELVRFAFKVYRWLMLPSVFIDSVPRGEQGQTPRQTWRELRLDAYWQDHPSNGPYRGGFQALVRRAVAELGGAV